jgi:hypothetical protein
MIGSPNGLAVGYFLAQHKHHLGNKAVEKVTVFRADSGMMPYLLFWIKDAPSSMKGVATSNSKEAEYLNRVFGDL